MAMTGAATGGGGGGAESGTTPVAGGAAGLGGQGIILITYTPASGTTAGVPILFVKGKWQFMRSIQIK